MTDHVCVICLCPTDHTLSPTTCGCTFPVHESCSTKLYHCVYCNTRFRHDHGISLRTETNLATALMTTPYHLINSYFYNSHDLKILLDQYEGDLLRVVSRVKADGRRYVATIEYDSPIVSIPTAFRTQLSNFHESFRVQFIFMSANRPIDESDVSIKSIPTETTESFAELWAMKSQPKW